MMWLVAIASGSIVVAFYFAYRLGTKNSDYKHAVRDIEDLEDEAQDWADMPLTDDDVINKLRERIAKKNKAKDHG
jgi:hypothetical protein